MASVFTFKRNETTSMKLLGVLNTEDMMIEIENVEKNLATLLSPFDGKEVTLTVKVATDEELDEPTEE